MTPYDLSLVICTLNESESIGAVLREVDRVLAGVPTEVIVVDDSEDDATARAVRAVVPIHVHIRLMRRRGERGLATAAAAGWGRARGRVLGLMDGDGQHDASLLPALLKTMQLQHADFAVASRYITGANTGLTGFRDHLSQLGTWSARLATGVNTSDPMSGFFLFRRDWWEAAQVKMSPVGYKILLDLTLSGTRKPKIVEVATSLRARIGGQSKLDVRVIADLAALILSKQFNGALSPRFVLFAGVGASGMIVNMSVVTAMAAMGAAYGLAQAVAVLIAMTTNFVLNNLLTFRDRRLGGMAFWRGLAAFYAACGGGAIVNELLGMKLYAMGTPAALAAFCGASLAVVWNYAAATRIAWAARASRSPLNHGNLISQKSNNYTPVGNS